MNDRFKFRAWNVEKREMWYMDNPYHSMVIAAKLDMGVKSGFDLILMQCTGLKDANGVLIYEGDRIKYCKHDGKPYDGFVKWFKDGFRIYRGGIPDCDFCSVADVEVIGNIYENPELRGEGVS